MYLHKNFYRVGMKKRFFYWSVENLVIFSLHLGNKIFLTVLNERTKKRDL